MGSPDLSAYRLVDMHTSIIQKEVKDAILKAVYNPLSPLHVVINFVQYLWDGYQLSKQSIGDLPKRLRLTYKKLEELDVMENCHMLYSLLAKLI